MDELLDRFRRLVQDLPISMSKLVTLASGLDMYIVRRDGQGIHEATIAVNGKPWLLTELQAICYDQGKIGMKLFAGQRVLTATNRLTTPFPQFRFGKVNTARTLKDVEVWLLENGIAEAKAIGNDMLLTALEAERKHAGKLPQASKDCLEILLFYRDAE
jgi:hypothetical protein